MMEAFNEQPQEDLTNNEGLDIVEQPVQETVETPDGGFSTHEVLPGKTGPELIKEETTTLLDKVAQPNRWHLAAIAALALVSGGCQFKVQAPSREEYTHAVFDFLATTHREMNNQAKLVGPHTVEGGSFSRNINGGIGAGGIYINESSGGSSFRDRDITTIKNNRNR